MKNLLLTFVLLLTVSFAFANTSINKTPKDIDPIPYFFELNIEMNSQYFINDLKTKVIEKEIKPIVETDCGSFAYTLAVYALLIGENYWTAWFYAFGHCIENME